MVGYGLLSRLLGDDQPFYSIQPRGLDGSEPPLETIQELAAENIRLMRTVQPHGPYYIGGYCAGGVIAFEMAQQLTASGDEIAFLGLFDAARRRSPEAAAAARESSFARFVTYWDLQIGSILVRPPTQRTAFFRMALARKLTHIGRKFMGKLGVQSGPGLPEAAQRVRVAGEAATRKYIPAAYPGKITLFLSRDSALRIALDSRMSWGELAGDGMELHLVAGDHVSIMQESGITGIGEEIKSCLDRAQAKAGVTGHGR